MMQHLQVYCHLYHQTETILFKFFFTSPICHASEFHLPICGQEWGTVFFASGWACGDVLGGIRIDGNIANFAFSKVHFCTIFLSNFMSIFFHSLISLLCKCIISWCLLTKSMILTSIVASFFTSILYSCISTIITHCAAVMYCWFYLYCKFFHIVENVVHLYFMHVYSITIPSVLLQSYTQFSNLV